METRAALLKIGDFARLAGTNLRTLRYYEELGLLAPAERSKGGFRYYRSTDVNRLNMIRNLQELGLQLERIREVMSTRQNLGNHRAFLEGVRQALKEQDLLLVRKIDSLRAQRVKVADALDKISECEGCIHTPGHGNNFCDPCQATGEPLPEDVSALY